MPVASLPFSLQGTCLHHVLHVRFVQADLPALMSVLHTPLDAPHDRRGQKKLPGWGDQGGAWAQLDSLMISEDAAQDAAGQPSLSCDD